MIILLISNTIAIIFSLTRLVVDIKDNKVDSYYETFYPSDKQDSNGITYTFENLWEKEELDKIVNDKLSHEQIIGGAWAAMVALEINLFCLIVVLKLARKFIKKCKEKAFDEENLLILHKMKKNLVISYVIPLIISIGTFIFISISINSFIGLFTVLALYALFDFVEYLIRKGLELTKPKKKEA